MDDFEKLREAISGDGIFRQATPEELEDRAKEWPPFIEARVDLFLDGDGELTTQLDEPAIHKGDIMARTNDRTPGGVEYHNDVDGTFIVPYDSQNWFNALQEDPYDDEHDVEEAPTSDTFKPASEEELEGRFDFERDLTRAITTTQHMHHDYKNASISKVIEIGLEKDMSADDLDAGIMNVLNALQDKITFADVKNVSAYAGRPIHIEEY